MSKEKKPIMTLNDKMQEEAEKLAGMTDEERKKYLENLKKADEIARQSNMKTITMDEIEDSDNEITYVTLDNIGSIFIDFKVKSRDGKTSRSRSKVYFATVTEELDKYLDIVSGYVLDKFNCDIYYLDNKDDVDDHYLDMKLSQMELFIFPITKKIIANKGKDIEFEIATAQKYGIPFLPILFDVTPEEFNKTIGSYEVYNSSDKEVKTKIEKFLNNIFVIDEIRERIIKEFKATIFLSYRKKDIKYAKKLMEIIHSNNILEDIAIWYDDYLTPGEDFNDEISKALLSSDLFILLVTPNLVNENNYVMVHEYPMAVNHKKVVLPSEAKETDKELLKEKYIGINDPVIIDEINNYQETIRKILESKLKEVNDSEVHKYYIGLAYLHGINVEKNTDHAIRLLVESADKSYIPAIETLLGIFDKNIKTSIPVEKIISYGELAVEYYQKQFEKNNYINIERFWAIANYMVTEYILANYLDRAKELINMLFEVADKRDVQTKVSKEGLARLTYRLAITQYTRGIFEEAKTNAEKAYVMIKEVLQMDRADKPIDLYINITSCIVNVYIATGNTQEAYEISDRFSNEYKVIKENDKTDLSYVIFCNVYISLLLKLDKLDKALLIKHEATKMIDNSQDKDLAIDMKSQMAASLGTYYSNKDPEKALPYLKEALLTIYEMSDIRPLSKNLRLVKNGINYAYILAKTGDFNNSIIEFNKVWDILKEYNIQQRYQMIKGIIEPFLNILINTNKYEDAVRIIEEYLDLIESKVFKLNEVATDYLKYCYLAINITKDALHNREENQKLIKRCLVFLEIFTENDRIKRLKEALNELLNENW